MEIHNIYAVFASQDTIEGRWVDYFTGISFYSKLEAEKFVMGETYAKKYGVMGTKGSSHNVKQMTLFVFRF